MLSELLSLGIVPILNENDAVSNNQGYKNSKTTHCIHVNCRVRYETYGRTFADNDSLASLIAVEMSADVRNNILCSCTCLYASCLFC